MGLRFLHARWVRVQILTNRFLQCRHLFGITLGAWILPYFLISSILAQCSEHREIAGVQWIEWNTNYGVLACWAPPSTQYVTLSPSLSLSLSPTSACDLDGTNNDAVCDWFPVSNSVPGGHSFNVCWMNAFLCEITLMCSNRLHWRAALFSREQWLSEWFKS